MRQVVDLQRDRQIGSMGLEVLSIAPDSAQAWAAAGRKLGITTPLLSDPGNRVAAMFGVMRWGMGTMPGHTFVLIDRNGVIRWVRDYGAPEHGSVMYVSPSQLLPAIRQHLKAA